ncbi:rhamnulokinase [Saccharibacillus deserti]|uniref:rhamnulokinase n=1 Tax=Saccharibacillus deserti TaxID=1634444 RepID=UPI001FE5D5B3|nr:rhamnulokinase family protein [Saccharibacillus deserti]
MKPRKFDSEILNGMGQSPQGADSGESAEHAGIAGTVESSSVKRVLAVDLGASSGRVMLGSYDGSKLELREIHRFDNVPVEDGGGLYWDEGGLFAEIQAGIRLAAAEGQPILGIGVDTWGVDYGWIGQDGELLRPPHHYRDARMARHAAELERRLPPREQFELTGNQPNPINTVYQIFADLEEQPELREQASRLLMMPDLFHYRLCGAAAAERSILSTGGLLAAGGSEPSAAVLERLGIPAALLAPVVPAGTVLGELRPELQAQLRCGPLRVVAGASHDTASAVAAVPYGGIAAAGLSGAAASGAVNGAAGWSGTADIAGRAENGGMDGAAESADMAEKASGAPDEAVRTPDGRPADQAAGSAANEAAFAAFISCGTWSIAGIETPRPILSGAAYERGLTNEVCYGGGNRLLKNITGLWLLQECRRHWNAGGEALSHGDLAALAEAAGPAASRIDPDDPRFAAPGDMPERVRQYCRETGQPVPGSHGELARVVLESLADAYARAIDELESITGRAIAAVHLVGGGSRNRLLCRLTAERTGREVIAGPVEASAAGSALVQLAALGELDFDRRAEILGRSFALERYLPDEPANRQIRKF